jgi:hypothetical protein
MASRDLLVITLRGRESRLGAMGQSEYVAEYNHLMAEVKGLPANPPDDASEVVDALRGVMGKVSQVVQTIDEMNPPYD